MMCQFHVLASKGLLSPTLFLDSNIAMYMSPRRPVPRDSLVINNQLTTTVLDQSVSTEGIAKVSLGENSQG